MAQEKENLNAVPKRKLLLILRIILLTAAVFYLLFWFYNNFLAEPEYQIYFSTNDASYLRAESRTLPEDVDIYLQLFKELKAGPESKELTQTIPEGVELLEYEIEAKKIILNFNLALKNNHWGGSTGERLTVYSIVNTYTDLDEIESVLVLLEGENVETLVGHLDLSRPLMYNQKLTGDS